jgi:transcriptional regulator with XRE-family HTH domain
MKQLIYDELLSIMGKNLHTIRNARKETLQGVASEIGFSHPILSKIENGRYPNVQLSLLVKLCNHYNIGLQQLFSIEIANIFQLTQNNKDGSQKLIGQELSTGYDLYTQQLLSEVAYLKSMNMKLLEKLV